MHTIYNETTEMLPTILSRKMKVKRICDTIPHPPRLSATSQDMYITAHGNASYYIIKEDKSEDNL